MYRVCGDKITEIQKGNDHLLVEHRARASDGGCPDKSTITTSPHSFGNRNRKREKVGRQMIHEGKISRERVTLLDMKSGDNYRIFECLNLIL